MAEWPIKRSGHVSVAIGNVVLVWGGYTDPPNAEQALDIYLPPHEVWLYCTETNKWIRHITEGLNPPGLSGAQAVYVAASRSVYIICGFMSNGHTNDIYRLDITTWSWTYIDIEDDLLKPSPRDKFGAWESENSIYIFGGYGFDYINFLHESGSYFPDYTSLGPTMKGWNNQLLVFNTATNTWTNPECTGNVPSPRAAHGSVCLRQEAYIFGGRHDTYRLNDLYSLNLSTLHWTQITVTGEIPSGRSWHSLTPISEYQICLFGGYTTDRQTLGDAWVFDTLSCGWKQFSANSLRPHLWHTAACTSDNDVIVFGGCSNDILSNADPTVHTHDLIVLRISPRTLFRLCMDAVYSYKKLLMGQWTQLPQPISQKLFER